MQVGNYGRVTWLACVLLLAAVALSGCVEVQIVDATPVAGSDLVQTAPELPAGGPHDLAVLAVDFDPPLDYHHLITLRQPISLLVAVENRGGATERKVAVAVLLTSPEAPALEKTGAATIESISPGEIQVVRFPALQEIPLLMRYRLDVTVGPLEEERSLSDNRMSFEIKIRPEQGSP